MKFPSTIPLAILHIKNAEKIIDESFPLTFSLIFSIFLVVAV
jgi:hypothetical protein